MDVGDFSLEARDLSIDRVPWGIGPRRGVLDKILLDGAIDAGVQVQDEIAVDHVLTEAGRVTGVRVDLTAVFAAFPIAECQQVREDAELHSMARPRTGARAGATHPRRPARGAVVRQCRPAQLPAQTVWPGVGAGWRRRLPQGSDAGQGRLPRAARCGIAGRSGPRGTVRRPPPGRCIDRLQSPTQRVDARPHGRTTRPCGPALCEDSHIPLATAIHPPTATVGRLARRYLHTYDLMVACTASGLGHHGSTSARRSASRSATRADCTGENDRQHRSPDGWPVRVRRRRRLERTRNPEPRG
jgi:hypothetical protein